jgi:hypothetical protein
MIYVDDRTEEQKQTHRLAFVGTDSFMSGWGMAEGGVSYAGWAFQDNGREDRDLLINLERRGDLKRLRLVALKDYRPRGKGHCHIYVYEPSVREVS